jgi:glc operon protein GlcG
MQKLLTGTAVLALAALAHAADLTTQKTLNLAVAKQIAAAAEAEAVKNNWTVVITILDAGGNPLYMQRMDNTQIGSIEVARAKAYSAVGFKRPTKTFEDNVVGGRQAILKLPGALPVEGGIPLMIGDRCLGAIGVSGVTSVQDGQIAKAGADEFAKIAAASK